MHRDHDHCHDDDHDHEHEMNGHAGELSAEEIRPGPGHNHAAPAPRPVQWQTPHTDHPHDHEHDHGHGEPDIDLVEAAFVQGFTSANDPTSFLRLARIPFQAHAADGASLVLLKVETDTITDVGGISPRLGGGGILYDPLPSRLVSQRRRLRFIYYDGKALRVLPLAEVRALAASDSPCS